MAIVAPEKLLPEWAIDNSRVAELLIEYEAVGPALQQFGVEQFQAGDPAFAAKAFQSAAALNPAQAIYRNNLGVALNASGDADGAIEAFRASLEIDKTQAQIWLNLAYTLKPLGRLDEAEQALLQAITHPDTQGEAFASLGTLALEQGAYEKAAGFLTQAVKAFPDNAALQSALGAALFQTGKAQEAAAHYAIAAQLNPEAGFSGNLTFLTMLSGIIAGNADDAITAYARPLTDDALLLDAFNRALIFFTSFDQPEAAQVLIDEWLQYYPEDEEGLYFEQIFAGKKLSRAPAGYIACHFDRMATVMDEAFLQAMAYHVPAQMAVILAKAAGRKWQGDILDAGCGNGIGARDLKPFAKTLSGIDLSPRMAEMAKATGLYDDVVTGDLLPWLQSKSLDYDLVVAADVLVYFGALEFVFAAAHAALRPGGWFLFSLETNAGEEPYALQRTGRFAHAKSYVAEVGAKAFTLIRDKDLILRLQGQKQVQGTIYLFQKT